MCEEVKYRSLCLLDKAQCDSLSDNIVLADQGRDSYNRSCLCMVVLRCFLKF